MGTGIWLPNTIEIVSYDTLQMAFVAKDEHGNLWYITDEFDKGRFK